MRAPLRSARRFSVRYESSCEVGAWAPMGCLEGGIPQRLKERLSAVGEALELRKLPARTTASHSCSFERSVW
jgi:hypothetical protein